MTECSQNGQIGYLAYELLDGKLIRTEAVKVSAVFLVLFFADTEFTGEKMSISEKAYALAVCEENSV
jgi:hypothetical protein